VTPPIPSRRYGGDPGSAALAPAGTGLVLVVDDQEDNRILTERYLVKEGYRVELAENGERALEKVRDNKPHLILLDVMMPGENGFEICRRLKNDPQTLDIPVVLITGLQRKDDRIAGKEAGADDFLSKPYYPEEMLARVRSLMRLAEARRALEQARLAHEVEQRERIRGMFERYVSPKLVKEILTRNEGADNPLERLSRIHAVALFADIRGFTRMVEQLEPGVVVQLLNDFFTRITSIAYSYQGTVINMAGDSLLVAFGVPLPQADATVRAVKAGIAMVEDFRAVARSWHSQFDIEVGLGVGIGQGSVIAGNVGSPTYMSYTIIGDAVNVGARLMQNAHAEEILVSEPVLKGLGALAEQLHVEPLAPILLKGKSAPLSVYRIKP
jgi:class 3 adenylate cyclase